MPSVEQNYEVWDREYGWSQQGEEWSGPWGSAEAQWRWTVAPRIRSFVPAGTILEIAPGFGRWTRYLKDLCTRLVVVDLSERCIEACRQRFAAESHIAYYVNDGRSLDMVADRSIDFVFSFDSLVHADADVIEDYLRQLGRKLTPDGVGLIHHSNWGAYGRYHRRAAAADPWLPARAKDFLTRIGVLEVEQFRSRSVNGNVFERLAREAGLQCISQKMVNWRTRRLIDCFSVFTRQGSRVARPNHVIANPGFMAEVAMAARLSSLYVLETSSARD